jgi:alpha-methylacyl-CoA racemase
MNESFRPMTGLRVVSLALNLPGPLAAYRFALAGGEVTKVEPPSGDPLTLAAPEVYRQLHEGMKVIQADLKTAAGLNQLEELLASADLFLTSSRLGALDRLGLSWEGLQSRHPSLSMVAIVGHRPPDENHPGHDLTYQAEHGLLNPPALPSSLFADLGGSLEAFAAGLGLLLARARGSVSPEQRRQIVSLERSADFFAQPRQWGLTLPGGFLGGGLPQYNLYRCETGWVALAALEPHFWIRLQSMLGLENPTQEQLQEVFGKQSADVWQVWARQHDLPLVAVKGESTMKSSST